MKGRWVIEVLLFFCLIIPAGAQVSNFNFMHLSVDHGLSQNSVFCILQDRKGFLWFGTQDGGLNKYDGYNFTPHTNILDNPESIGGNNISKLFEDSAGNIWIGTWGSGLDMYDPVFDLFTHYQYSPGCPGCISHNRIQSIIEDLQGNLWIGTAGGGLNKFNPELRSFKHYKFDPDLPNGLLHNRIWDLVFDHNGLLWIATDIGISIFNQDRETFVSLDSFIPNSLLLAEKQVRCLNISQDGSIWAGTSNGLFKIDVKNRTIRHVQLFSTQATDAEKIEINELFEDDSGQLWIGSHEQGIFLFNPESEKVNHLTHDPNVSTSLSFNDIRDIYQDVSGNIWIATRGGGVNKLNLNSKKFRHFSHNPLIAGSLSSNSVWAICEDIAGRLWVGTYGGGLNLFDKENGEFKHYLNSPKQRNSLSNNNVLSLSPGKDGVVWIGTQGGGLNKFDSKTGEFRVYTFDPMNVSGIGDDLVSCVVEDNGVLWVGTDQGLNKMDIQTETFLHFIHIPEDTASISDNRIWAIYKDKGGRLWVGTDNGLNLLNQDSDIFHRFLHQPNNPLSISDNDIFCIHQDQFDNMWFGTGRGLNRFNPTTNKFERLNSISPFLGNPIYGIIEDNNNNLWITTINGLIRLNPENNSVKHYDASDGLQSNEFNRGAFWKNKDSGEIFIGGINGFNSYFPDQIKENAFIPPIVITQFSLFNQPVGISSDGPLYQSISETSEIRLTYRQYDFSFRFVALNYTNSHKNQYKYRLLGYENEWKEVGSDRIATYTNISHGEYQFRVIGSNNDGVWNDDGAAISIIITPPFWKTTLFYIGCVLFLILFVLFVIKIRERRLIREKRVLEKRVAERTEEVVRQKTEIEKKNLEITDSINYAQRIQNAILPEDQEIARLFPESFILFLPKDIVSGDFYWFGEHHGNQIVAVVDCTGHGVPGAFMSMIGNSLLNQIIHENNITSPSEILYHLDKGVKHALRQEGTGLSYQDDGMDASIFCFKDNQKELLFAGASLSSILIHDRALRKIEGDIYSIGGVFSPGINDRFASNKISLHSGDLLYLYSDGYQDQFGGLENTKFMASGFEKLLLEISTKTMTEQKKLLNDSFTSWRRNVKQTDDVLVIGLKPRS